MAQVLVSRADSRNHDECQRDEERTNDTACQRIGRCICVRERAAQEVSSGKVELPSFPDVAVRVRKVLADEQVSNEQIARIVGSDAGLAARVLTLANSAALNRSGRSVGDLKTAVNRIGHNNVRTAAVSFAIAQLRRASELRNIAPQLELVWQEATLVAALSYSIAARCQLNSDESMLAGLLHNVGKLYILARANRHGSLFSEPAALARSCAIGTPTSARRSSRTGASPSTSPKRSASTKHRSHGRPGRCHGRADGCSHGGRLHGPRSGLRAEHAGRQGVQPLSLDNAKCAHIMQSCSDEISALRSALGD
jgi:hypothetical protein